MSVSGDDVNTARTAAIGVAHAQPRAGTAAEGLSLADGEGVAGAVQNLGHADGRSLAGGALGGRALATSKENPRVHDAGIGIGPIVPVPSDAHVVAQPRDRVCRAGEPCRGVAESTVKAAVIMGET